MRPCYLDVGAGSSASTWRRTIFPGLGLRAGRQLHVQVLHQEAPQVGPLLDLFGGGLVTAMAGLGVDADQDGRVASLRMLERRDELVAVRRDDPVVVIGSVSQRRRIVGAGLDAVVR